MIEQHSFYRIEPLGKHHNKRDFSCGINALDGYLQQQAGQEARKYVAATFVLVETGSEVVAGYYTLSSIGINAGELPEAITSKLPKYPLLPATLLGRLAIDKNYQGKKVGELLLMDALKRSLNLSKEVASMAVIVEAKNEQSLAFYRRYGFISFSQRSQKLFLPMATIAKSPAI